MDHRRTISRRSFVPPAWLMVLTFVAIVAGIGAVGWLIYDTAGGDSDPAPAASPTATSTQTVQPTPEPEPTPEPSPEPTPEPPPEPVVVREAGVSVLNQSNINGLAGRVAADLRNVGWSDVTAGNWTGAVPENTVYYAAGLQSQAELLAADLAITRILPRVDQMRDRRLTLVLTQQPSSVP